MMSEHFCFIFLVYELGQLQARVVGQVVSYDCCAQSMHVKCECSLHTFGPHSQHCCLTLRSKCLGQSSQRTLVPESIGFRSTADGVFSDNPVLTEPA